MRKSLDEAMEYARNQIHHPTQGWKCLCQSFSRNTWGLPAYAPSAKVAWLTQPKTFKHRVSWKSKEQIAKIPRGAIIYSTAGTYGHAYIATKNQCISTDYKRTGYVDYAPRDMSKWANVRMGIVGWVCGVRINGKDYYFPGIACKRPTHRGKH